MKSAHKIVPDLDLNLLRVLVALDQTRNVSRAAELLGMSQSGFSTAVLRLRRHFGDEMFIRASGSMQPTALAQRIAATAGEVLARISGEILGNPVFDPLTSQTDFHLAMADVAEVLYLPRLLRRLALSAPSATVATGLLPGGELHEAMASGRVDLAIGYFPDLDSQQFFKQQLYTHTYACIARRGHPMGSKLSVSAYERCGHAVAATPARTTALLESFLLRKRIERHVVLRTPHHLALPTVVAQTDLIATVPMAVAGQLADSAGIQVLALPFTPPSFAVQQHWHRKVHKDPRNKWLRSELHALFSEDAARWAALESSLYGRRMRGADVG